MKLMQDIKNLREVNKTLTDEERRKNAEDMILKLSQYMNLNEEGEDEEDEDEAYTKIEDYGPEYGNERL
jgi:hypothetical protein